MIMHRASFTNWGTWLAPALAGLLLFGCSDDNPVKEAPLCGGENGVGLRVEGRAQPVDVCVSDSAVDALLSSNRYNVTAQLTLDDDSTVQLLMVFTQHLDTPVTLRLVNSITEATSDPATVYVFYEEIPGGPDAPIQSTLITGGRFRLTFNDDQVAVGTLENIAFDMSNVQTGDPAGGRTITEGFFSVTVTPPAVTTSSN